MHDLLYVKSHQDRFKKQEELSWNKCLNQRVDQIMSLYLTYTLSTSLVIPFLLTSEISVQLYGITVYHQFASTLIIWPLSTLIWTTWFVSTKTKYIGSYPIPSNTFS